MNRLYEAKDALTAEIETMQQDLIKLKQQIPIIEGEIKALNAKKPDLERESAEEENIFDSLSEECGDAKV